MKKMSQKREFLPPRSSPANLDPILTLVKYLSFLGYPLTIRKVQGGEIEVQRSPLRTWMGLIFFLLLFAFPAVISSVSPEDSSTLSVKSYFTSGVISKAK